MYRRSPAIEETTVGDRVVLYHRIKGTAVVLNPTASILWSELAAAGESKRLSRALLGRYPSLEPSRIDADVQACLDELEKHQLVIAGA